MAAVEFIQRIYLAIEVKALVSSADFLCLIFRLMSDLKLFQKYYSTLLWWLYSY